MKTRAITILETVDELIKVMKKHKEDFIMTMENEFHDLLHEVIALRKEVAAYKAIEPLLADDEVHWGEGENGKPEIYIMLNDVFAPAADAEEISRSQWLEVAEIYKRFPRYGLIAWVAIKNEITPMPNTNIQDEYQKTYKELLKEQ